jgi:hypothetical protein
LPAPDVNRLKIFSKGRPAVGAGRLFALAAAFFFASAAYCEVKWNNLDDSRRLGGRKVSEGYLQGKVVMVVRLNAASARCNDVLAKAEEVWRNFKSKPFVMLGSGQMDSASPSEMRSLIEENLVSFPVYEEAALAVEGLQAKKAPYFYVVNPLGKIIYSGAKEHYALQAVVIGLTDLASPRNADQLKRFIEYEIAELPASAHLRLKILREKDPGAAAPYEEQWRKLDSDVQVRKVSRIVEVVKRLKDFAPRVPADTRRYPAKVKEALSRFSNIKDITDPRLVREVKNSIAELKWLEASL